VACCARLFAGRSGSPGTERSILCSVRLFALPMSNVQNLGARRNPAWHTRRVKGELPTPIEPATKQGRDRVGGGHAFPTQSGPQAGTAQFGSPFSDHARMGSVNLVRARFQAVAALSIDKIKVATLGKSDLHRVEDLESQNIVTLLSKER